MTTDAQISADLAVLGKASRERPIPFATTLAALAPKPRVTTANDVAIARVFVARVGRIAMGAALLALIAGLCLRLVVPPEADGYGDFRGEWDVLWHGVKWQIVLAVVGVAALVRLIVTGIVEARIARSPLREVPRWLDRGSAWFAIAATSATVLMVGWLYIVLGRQSFRTLFDLHAQVPSWDFDDERLDRFTGTAAGISYVLGAIVTAMGAAGIAAVFATRARAVPRWLVVVAVLVGFATVLVGLTRDIGPLLVTFTQSRTPSMLLRSVLLATGTFSIVTLVAWRVLARRNRENAAMDGTIAPDETPRPGDRA